MAIKRVFPVALALFTMAAPVDGRTRKGDVLIAVARQSEAKDTTASLEKALELAQQALETDRLDISYQLEVSRLRAFAAQYHVYDGQVLRDKGKLDEALAEFQKAAVLDPASSVAPEEAARTRELIRLRAANPNINIEQLLDRPLSRRNRMNEELFSNSAPAPRLVPKPGQSLPVMRVNNQPASEVFRAFAKQAGMRILFDPDYQNRPLGLNQTLDFHGLNLEQALDYLALVTKSFWKPLAPDTIFVSNDDPTRRGAYEEQVTKAFYLTNVPGTQDLTDVAGTVQKLTDIRKLFVHPEQNVIVARSDADRVALAEKVIADLDKPKAEIIVDVIIMSVAKSWIRDLGVNLGVTESNTNILFAPRAALNPATVAGRAGIPLDAIRQLETGDFNVTLPGVALDALLQTRGTKLLDKAQLRTVEGLKSSLRIGQKVPYATGSFSPGASAGISALVNTQFQFFDVGLNIDVLARVHEPDEVSLHIESDTSSVADRVDLGGVQQPVIAQRKRIADVRVKEGEINFWDIVTQRQDIKTISGLPGLAQIPVLGRFFSSEHVEKSEQQVLTLLIPHIIRPPDIRKVNLLGIASGSDQVVRMRYNSPEGPVSAAETEPNVIEVTSTGDAAIAAAGTPGAPPGMGAAPAAMPVTQPGMPPAPAQAAGPTITFQPAAARVGVQSPISVNLVVNGASDTKEAIIVVQFDPKGLKFVKVTAGPLVMPGGAIPAGQKMEDGAIVFKLNPIPAGAPVSGMVATLEFQAVAAGVQRVSASSRFMDSQGREQNVMPGALEVTVQ